MKWNYLSKTKGIGGRIKEQIEDFIVKEKSLFKLGKGNHLIAYLTKYNMTTLDAIRELSNVLHISQDRFGFAGNKDRRAITTQAISIYDLKEEDLKFIFLPNMELKVIGYGERIKLGDLEGNAFEVVIRNINLPEEEILRRVNKIHNEELKEVMPNYFGEQRFGNRFINHLIGKEILKRNYEEAVWLYIGKTGENEPERIRKIRKEIVETKEVGRAAEKFPVTYRFEKILLYHLAKKKDDYLGAIKQLPEGLQKLFIHAFQSYVFNEVLSELIKENAIGDYEIPLPGYRIHLKDELPDIKVKEILEREGISLDDFKLKELEHLRTEGEYRKALVNYKNFRILSLKEDDLNIDKYALRLRFFLGKGSYATSLLREFMKG